MTKFPKQVLFGLEAQNKLLQGINTVAEAVGTTLGPRGRNVAIEQAVDPLVVHDGVTVANWIELKDPFENMGASLLRRAAGKTNEVAGDGTTTSTVLAQAIVTEALKQVQAGRNPMVVKAEIESSLKAVLEELTKLSTPIKTLEESEQVATISSGDQFLGRLVAQALEKTGKDGVVAVELGNQMETEVTYQQGMQIDRGYLSPYFVTDAERVESVIENPYILITDKKINYNFDLVPFLEKMVGVSTQLVIFAGEVADETMATLVANRLRGGWQVCAIQAPAYGGRRTDELEDLAILTGGTAILEDSGRLLKDVEISELGRAEKIVADRDKTLVLGGKGDPKAIEKRMNDLREQIKIGNTDYDKDIKGERLAKLAGGVAVIKVGGATEIEAKEKKERVVDAVNATKAAIEEGIVAGGEITLLKLAETTSGILAEALKQPFKRLVTNAGLDYAEVRERMANSAYPEGIDVLDGQRKNLIEAGVIDPVKVTRSALENAVSIATMVVSTNVLVVEERTDEKA